MATLDTNDLGAVTTHLAATTETLFTLYVYPLTGTHDNFRVGLEMSPDNGTNWTKVPEVIRGLGCFTVSHVATRVRAVVVDVEGATSTVTVILLAR